MSTKQSKSTSDKSSNDGDENIDIETDVEFEDIALGDNDNKNYRGYDNSENMKDIVVKDILLKEFSQDELPTVSEGGAFVEGTSHELDTVPMVNVP